jgi:hypothetical protein
MKGCNNCTHGKCFYHKPPKCPFEPKEKPMTDKFMFDNEKQAKEMFLNCNLCSESTVDIFIKNVKEKGYIRKSELQTLVDEAEEMYKKFIETGDCDGVSILMEIQNKAIQVLKKDHPEFNK